MKKILSLVLALVMVLGLTAAFADDFHFEIVSKGFQSTYWQAVLKGVQEEVDNINGEGVDKITFNFVGLNADRQLLITGCILLGAVTIDKMRNSK